MTVKDLIDTIVYPETTVFEIAAKDGEFHGEDYDAVYIDSPLIEYIKEYTIHSLKATDKDRIRIRIW